jgi:hypothetical protein
VAILILMNTTQDISKLSNDELFNGVVNAMAEGRLNVARAYADEICRPERARECVDLLPRAADCGSLAGYSEEVRQPLEDRIAQYNSYVLDR